MLNGEATNANFTVLCLSRSEFEPTIVVDRGFIGGVMVIVFTSSVVDRGFIGGVMVIGFASSVVDRGFELRSAQT
jgi:hypothetical protein